MQAHVPWFMTSIKPHRSSPPRKHERATNGETFLAITGADPRHFRVHFRSQRSREMRRLASSGPARYPAAGANALREPRFQMRRLASSPARAATLWFVLLMHAGACSVVHDLHQAPPIIAAVEGSCLSTGTCYSTGNRLRFSWIQHERPRDDVKTGRGVCAEMSCDGRRCCCCVWRGCAGLARSSLTSTRWKGSNAFPTTRKRGVCFSKTDSSSCRISTGSCSPSIATRDCRTTPPPTAFTTPFTRSSRRRSSGSRPPCGAACKT